MGILLTKVQRQGLKLQHKIVKDRRICDRIKAVLAYDDGHSYAEIARWLLLDDETIKNHINDYVNEHKLNTNNGGSKPALTEEQTMLLMGHLDKHVYLYVKDICAYVETTFEVRYSISGMTKWLKGQGFAYKKPHAIPAKANLGQQEEFIKYYNKLKEEAGKSEPIYFADSVHPHHQTQIVSGWIRKGERRAVKTTGRQYHLNFIGAIRLDNYEIQHLEVDKVDGAKIKTFLEQISKNNPMVNQIHLIWDNAGYHKSKEIVAYAERLRIKIHYLPPYSPNLNPIERLWKVMRENTLYNHYYEKFADFAEAVRGFFENLTDVNEVLHRRINDNFHVIDCPLFES